MLPEEFVRLIERAHGILGIYDRDFRTMKLRANFEPSSRDFTMSDTHLSDSELNRLAEAVDRQLEALRAEPSSHVIRRSMGDEAEDGLPAALEQMKVIERETGDSFGSFWQKYLHHARRDLCLPGGMLYAQWRKWRDLESKSVVRVSYAWLAAMGIPAGSLGPVVVAASVFLLNVAVKIGIDTLCEGCEEDVEAGDLRNSKENSTGSSQ